MVIMSTNLRLGLALAIGVGLVGCNSSPGGSDGRAAPPDGSAAGRETAAPADVGSSAAAEASADLPTGGVEAGREVAASQFDASVDRTATPPDVASATDSLRVTPDAGTAEAVAQMDAAEAAARMDAAEAAKPADTMAFDSGKSATDLAPATLHEISPQDLHAKLANKDFLLIDVHYPNAGSIPGTDARIAYDDIPALVAYIGPNLDTKVVLTCLSGHMSKTAGDALVARGYRNISELTGGMNAWTAAGYPVVHLDGGM